jgi:hypothetical protein
MDSPETVKPERERGMPWVRDGRRRERRGGQGRRRRRIKEGIKFSQLDEKSTWDLGGWDNGFGFFTRYFQIHINIFTFFLVLLSVVMVINKT